MELSCLTPCLKNDYLEVLLLYHYSVRSSKNTKCCKSHIRLSKKCFLDSYQLTFTLFLSLGLKEIGHLCFLFTSVKVLFLLLKIINDNKLSVL